MQSDFIALKKNPGQGRKIGWCVETIMAFLGQKRGDANFIILLIVYYRRLKHKSSL
jgi:hypothetical protein